MTLTCQHCGHGCRDGARFCDQCGTALAAPAPPSRSRAELRLGTLLFCDLVNSTRLANELDPDDLRLVFAAFQRVARESLRRHDGHLVRWVGDGAFAVFGYPAAQEDSAESALRAGLTLVRAIRGERLPRVQGLQLRVGIASGPVVMGEMIGGSVIGEQSVTGPIAHLAARLAASATPDSVVICDDTRRLAGHRFEVESLGDLALKGFPAPVPAWRLLGEGSAVSRLDAQRGRGMLSDLVGRGDVLDTLTAHWARCNQGQAGGVLLLGDAGIGKSRLARALQRTVAADAPSLVDLHCSPRLQGSPLHPVGVLLRRLADVQSSDDAGAAADKARLLLAPLLPRDQLDGALRELLPLFQPQAAAAWHDGQDSPERVRQRMIDRLIAMLLGMAAHRPVLLLVEDLHWADPSTLALLKSVLERGAGSRLLLLATARTAELAEGDAPPGAAPLVLGPLAEAEARELVLQVAAGRPLDDAVLGSIVQRGEGNALFLEELARAALERGPDHLPGTLQHLVQARLDRRPQFKPVIQAAAVLGREFRWPLLAGLARDFGALEVAVRALVDEGLLVPGEVSSAGTLRFKHALIHDAVYQTLLRGERQRLHSLAADLMQQTELASGIDAAADLRAHHLAEAGRSSEAIDALLEASRTTAARAAYRESMGHLQRGLGLLGELDDDTRRKRLELQLKAQLGVPMTALMGYAVPEVERTYQDAAELVDESTPAEVLFPILRGLCTYYLVRGQMARADDLARQCLQLAERAGRAEMRIDALSFAAYPAMYLGRIAEASRHAEDAIALYQAEQGSRYTYPVPQDPATAAWALLNTSAWLGGDLARAEQAADALLAHVAALGRPFDIAYAKVWLAGSYQLQRRFAPALQLAQEGYALAEHHGLGTWVPAALLQMAIAGGSLTASPQSIGMLQQVHQAFLAAGADVSATFYDWGLAQAQLRNGDARAAQATIATGLARIAPGRERYMHAELLILRALCATDAQAARADLRAAAGEARAQGAFTVALRAAAQLALREGDAARAEQAQQVLEGLDGDDTSQLPADWMARQLVALEPSPTPSALTA